MDIKELTRWILISVAILFIIWDIIVVLTAGVDSTISKIILGVACKYPIFPFSFGVLMGHLFWPQRIEKK